jgi:3'(2'), 5'-bisphosphate nucleotidase
MNLTQGDLQELVAIVRQVGWGTADILRQMETSDLEAQDAGDGPVTLADRAANRYILDNLQASFGEQDFGYLSEETYKEEATGEPLPYSLVWVIDPLDGTKDYINKTGEYSLHIALVQNNRPILAVVGCPAAGTLYFATQEGGTFVEHRDGAIAPVRVADRDRLSDLVLVVSRSHRNERFNQLLQQLPCQKQRSVGSVGGKIAAILEHTADVYISVPGKSAPKDWDLAAPELIFTEAGGQFTNLDGTPIHYNRGEVSQWGGVLACNATSHPVLVDEISRILADS